MLVSIRIRIEAVVTPRRASEQGMERILFYHNSPLFPTSLFLKLVWPNKRFLMSGQTLGSFLQEWAHDERRESGSIPSLTGHSLLLPCHPLRFKRPACLHRLQETQAASLMACFQVQSATPPFWIPCDSFCRYLARSLLYCILYLIIVY